MSEFFTIDKNNILVNIAKKTFKLEAKYFPRRVTKNSIVNDNYIESFYYHYILDKNLLGINEDRYTERKVISIKKGLKITKENYYIDDRTGDVFTYKAHELKPLLFAMPDLFGYLYSVVNLHFPEVWNQENTNKLFSPSKKLLRSMALDQINAALDKNDKEEFIKLSQQFKELEVI